MLKFRTRTDRNGNYLCLIIDIDKKSYLRDYNRLDCVDASKMTKSEYKLLLNELEQSNFINNSKY